MNTSSKPRYATLRLWLISFVVFIFFNVFLYTLTAYFLHGKKMPSEAENLLTLERLEHSIQEFPDDLQVVVIGSSVMKNALWCPDDFDIYTSANSRGFPGRIRIFKIWESGLQLKYFTEELHLFDSLFELQPDLILVEDHLLLVDFNRHESGVISDYYYDYKLALLRGMNNLLRKPIKDSCVSADGVNELDSANVHISFRRTKSISENEYFDEVLEASKKVGIKLGLLESPRPTLFKEAINRKDVQSQITELKEYYIRNHNLLYIPFNKEFYWSYFLDEGHMNRKGQEQYSIWLIRTLEKHFGN